MDDEVSSGPDRPPRRATSVLTGAAVAALIVAYAVTHIEGGGTHRTSAPVAPPSSASAPAAVSSAVPQAPDVQPQLAGASHALPRGITVLLGGPHPSAVGTGPPETLAHVPVHQGESVARLAPATQGLVVQVDTALADPTKPSARFYWVRPGDRTTLLGVGDDMVMGVHRDRVLIVRYGYSPSTAAPTNEPASMTQVALDGRVLAFASLPAGATPVADTDQGLVTLTYTDVSNTTGRLELRNRTTFRVLRRLGTAGYVLTADGDRMVWVQPGCETRCALTELDLHTGVRHAIALPADYFVGSAAISPDGTRLALGYYGRHRQQPGGAAPGFVEVVDLATQERQRAPGVATAVKQSADLAWAPDSRLLAISVGWPDDDARRVALWSGGDPELAVVPGRYVGGSAPSALVVEPSTA